MRPQSAKSKGRRFQQYIRDVLLERSPELETDDIRSTSMGAPGEDLLFSPAARRVYPISVECKNVEKINIWDALKQAAANAGKYSPVLFFTKNHTSVYVTIELKYYLDLLDEKRK